MRQIFRRLHRRAVVEELGAVGSPDLLEHPAHDPPARHRVGVEDQLVGHVRAPFSPLRERLRHHGQRLMSTMFQRRPWIRNSTTGVRLRLRSLTSTTSVLPSRAACAYEAETTSVFSQPTASAIITTAWPEADPLASPEREHGAPARRRHDRRCRRLWPLEPSRRGRTRARFQADLHEDLRARDRRASRPAGQDHGRRPAGRVPERRRRGALRGRGSARRGRAQRRAARPSSGSSSASASISAT